MVMVGCQVSPTPMPMCEIDHRAMQTFLLSTRPYGARLLI
eukprot:COSAG06_NODE_15296_length_1082_cov_1.595117_1_plen_39_part_10